MSTTMENKTCELDYNREDEIIFPELDSAKTLLEATTDVKLCLTDQEFDERLCTLESYLLSNKINVLSDIVADTLYRINRVKADEITKEEFSKKLSIFTVALNDFIRKEEERKLDIFAIRRVGRMMYKNPGALYSAVFGKRE